MSISINTNVSAVQTAAYAKTDAGTVSLETRSPTVQMDVYEKTEETAQETEGVVYKPNTALVNQLKADLKASQLKFLTTVRDMLTKQGITVAEGEGIWKQLAQGDYEVDAETRAAAREAIADGGYWSVEKTSERLVTYARALVGGDPSRVEEMRQAFIKGYEAAGSAWGGSLPDISQKTYDATMKLFDEWAKEGQE